MTEKTHDFEYFISIKEPFLVIAFLGHMTKVSAAVIEKCQAEILASQAKFIVLGFRDVSKIDLPVVPALVKIQKSIRDAKKELRVASLRPDIKTLLLDAGAIRHEEVQLNLPDALQSFSKR